MSPRRRAQPPAEPSLPTREVLTPRGPRTIWVPEDREDTFLTTTGIRLTENTCGELIGRTIGRLTSAPSYVRAEDARWVVALLADLAAFEFDEPHVASHVRRGAIARSTTEYLDLYMRRWAEATYLQGALVESYVAAALLVPQMHVFGVWEAKWRLEPATCAGKPLDGDWRRADFFFNEPRFKREFTERHRGTKVVIRIPPGSGIELQPRGGLYGEGEVVFFMHRYFLSSTVAYEQYYAVLRRPGFSSDVARPAGRLPGLRRTRGRRP